MRIIRKVFFWDKVSISEKCSNPSSHLKEKRILADLSILHKITLTFGIMSSINFWPPNPGSTVMTRAISTCPAQGASSSTVVPGLIAMPTCQNNHNIFTKVYTQKHTHWQKSNEYVHANSPRPNVECLANAIQSITYQGKGWRKQRLPTGFEMGH